MAQNDISLEEVSRQNTIKEEKLKKMKSNIQALQLSLANKKTNKNINQKQVQPIAIYDHMQSFELNTKSPTYYQAQQNEFDYNSTLFKQITNESQPIINNGSGVSNFSSVSNINQILNGHHLQQTSFNHSQPPQNDNLMDNIDKLLSKFQKTQNNSNKVLDRIVNQKEHKPLIIQDVLTSSKFSNSGEKSAKAKLEQYRQFINKLDVIQEEGPRKDSWASNSNKGNDIVQWKRQQMDSKPKLFTKTFPVESVQQELNSNRTHFKEPSALTFRSEYPASQDYKFPPTPPGHPPKPMNAVERQKMRIKESMIQMKKLQTDSSHEILDGSIDFELSDQETEPVKEKRIDKKVLLKQKKQLEEQLKVIEQELKKLESQVQ